MNPVNVNIDEQAEKNKDELLASNNQVEDCYIQTSYK